jgi:hypothetical protein
MLEADLPGQLVAPFLHRVIEERISGWEELIIDCLDHPECQSAAISLILTQPDPPEDLLSQALKKLKGRERLIEVHCFRNEVSVGVLRELLHHSERAVVTAAVIGEWKAEPDEFAREEIRDEWEEALVTDAVEDYSIGQILKRRPSLAYRWLEARIEEGLPAIFTRNWEQTFQSATHALETEARSHLLHKLPDNDMMGEAVIHLVGDDLEVYRTFLEDDRDKILHLAPLSRSSDAVWIEMAKLAMDAGYSPADIAASTFFSVGVSVEWGPLSQKWEKLVQRFERLCEHEDVQIREIGQVGRARAEAMLQKALKQEHDEAVYGPD